MPHVEFEPPFFNEAKISSISDPAEVLVFIAEMGSGVELTEPRALDPSAGA